jgi:hypothetical protein
MAFEITGEWWRADGVDLSAAGGLAFPQRERDALEGSDMEHASSARLRFTPEEGLRLELLRVSERVYPADSDDFIIFGLTAGGTPCSLLGCVVTGSQGNFPSGYAVKRIRGSAFVHGAHVTSPDALVASRLVVRMPLLLEFLTAPVHANGSARPGLGHGDQTTRRVPIGDDELSFSIAERSTKTLRELRLERSATAVVSTAEGLSLTEWLDAWVSPLTRLVAFVTRQPTVASEISMLIESPGQGAEAGRHREIKVVLEPPRARTAPEFRSHRLVAGFAALGDRFDAFVCDWWRAHERLAGAGDFLFGALREEMSAEPLLVTLMSAVEGYHRAFHDSLALDPASHERITTTMLDAVTDASAKKLYGQRLKHAHELVQLDRLRAVIRRAGDVVAPLGVKAGRLADVAVTSRNYFVHLGAKTDRVLEGAALYEASQLLILSLYCNLLLDLGLEPQEALRGIERGYAEERFWSNLQCRACAWPKYS